MMARLESADLEITPKFRDFDWEKAKTFYYVAKFGGFASAGRFLNISQSALSRQVIYLERYLGSPLFFRYNSGIKLTQEGEELFAIVERAFAGLKEFTQEPHAKMAKGKKRIIRITTTHALNAYILDTLIFTYSDKHPNLIFELISEDHLMDIILNDVDIAIRPIDSRIRDIPKERGVQQEYLFSLEKKLYASPEYLEKYGEPNTVNDLKNHHLIGFAQSKEHPYSDVNWILKLGMPEGQMHKPVFASNSIECAIEAAKQGMGIVSSYGEYELIKESNLKQILSNVKCKEMKSYFIYPDYLKKDKEIIELKKYLQEKLG